MSQFKRQLKKLLVVTIYAAIFILPLCILGWGCYINWRQRKDTHTYRAYMDGYKITITEADSHYIKFRTVDLEDSSGKRVVFLSNSNGEWDRIAIGFNDHKGFCYFDISKDLLIHTLKVSREDQKCDYWDNSLVYALAELRDSAMIRIRKNMYRREE